MRFSRCPPSHRHTPSSTMAAVHTEAEEVAALDKALTALGFTDDSKLERVLNVLMPRVVDQMASVHASTKKKVMEILSHVNKRLKAQPTMKLPLADLTTLYVNLERPPMVRNFALVYVEQAFERATPEDRAAQITRLLHGKGANIPTGGRGGGEGEKPFNDPIICTQQPKARPIKYEVIPRYRTTYIITTIEALPPLSRYLPFPSRLVYTTMKAKRRRNDEERKRKGKK